jgi:hypothetical protein
LTLLVCRRASSSKLVSSNRRKGHCKLDLRAVAAYAGLEETTWVEPDTGRDAGSEPTRDSSVVLRG